MQDMNAKRVDKYSSLIAQCAECHRRVFPVVNTCLDNITQASAAVDSSRVRKREGGREGGREEREGRGRGVRVRN